MCSWWGNSISTNSPFRNVKFQSMKAEFSKSGSSWMVLNAQVTHRSGTLSGDVLNRPGDFRCGSIPALNPTELLSLCPPKFQHALGECEFQTPPVIQATFSGASPNSPTISGTGQIWLGKTTFRGTLLNSASATFDLQNNVVRCDQIRVIRDEGIGTGSFTCDFGQDRVTIEDFEANLSPEVVAVWIDPSVGRLLQPFHFTDLPAFMPAEQSSLRTDRRMIFTSGSMLRIDSRIILADGKSLSVRGSGDFSVLGTDSTNLSVSGTVSVLAAKISGSKFFAPLLTRLAPLGFREPVDLKLSFRLDPESLRLISLQLVSGSHAVRLTGSLYFPEISSISPGMSTTATYSFGDSVRFKIRSGN